MPPHQSLRPGDRLGPYEIVALLGAGGMGAVWRAWDPRLEREVALKVLPVELAEDPERLTRFEREAKALAALSHPNIITIHSVEEAEGVRFLTMERAEGETLGRLIPPGGMPLERFLSIAIPLADALVAAHAKRVLHRDLKPDNVMVTAEGRVKVLDFGLAKLAPDSAEDLTQAPTGRLQEMTQEGQILGTVPYMSPEQVQGRAVDARADLFSLGAVLYEMATGRRPFAGDSAVEVFYSILRDEPPSVTGLRPALPRQLGRILRRCLAKDPERRFQSAKDLRNELEELREEVREGAGTDRTLEAREQRSTERPLGPGAERPIPSDRSSMEASAGVGVRGSTGRRLRVLVPLVALVVALLAVGAALLRKAGEPSRPPGAEPSVAETGYPRTAIAVLPFRNLSADATYAYFAGGLHDELLTQLSRVGALSLRGRASVMGYEGSTKPIRQIAEELQVGALVEGSVQVAGGSLRVNVQLLDAATDEHLWAERYDRTLDDAFAIQSDVAQRVVAAVGAALGSGERRAMTDAPTANPEAYRLYLQGRDYFRRPGYGRQTWEIAQQLFERALALDPEFALAYAALSDVHGAMSWWRYDPSLARLEAQREAAETALRLAPELPQAHEAMAWWHYRGRRDWAAALEQLEIALRGLPNDTRLIESVGYVHRRLGNWDEVDAAFARAVALNPRDPGLFADLGGMTFLQTRRYADAVRAFDQALALAPDYHWAAVRRGQTHFVWQGDLQALRTAIEGIPPGADLGALGSVGVQVAELLLLERDAASLLEHLETSELDVLQGIEAFFPKSLYAGWAHQLRGDQEAARRAFAAANQSLDSVPPDLQGDWRVHVARGLAMAGRGDREGALRMARWLEQSPVYREDALTGSLLAADRARVLAQARETEAALDEIERLLETPSRLSAHTLRLDPRWDPIRDHPRFQALLTAHSRR